MTFTQREDFDEIPLRNKDGVVVGYGMFDGYADLIVADNEGELYFDGYANVFVKDKNGEYVALDGSDPLSVAIEFEIDRLIDAGTLRPKREELDGDYLRQVNIHDGIYIGLRAGAAA